MSNRHLYLRAAQDLRENPGQWAAYNAEGHCVVLAGPGSGKTKTLTVKMARMLAEDVEEPRGVACITYNNECARELEQRLDALGVEPGGRVFIGTIHSFSLTQILLPYAKAAGLGLPDGFKVATQYEQRGALAKAYRSTIGGPGNPQDSSFGMGRYRRSFLDRSVPEWKKNDLQYAKLVEAYEAELRAKALIDFDDMPLLAVQALRENEWLQRALLAKYPILIVDEYQDLGRALHGMVMGLCFSTGMRLFAVGDIDQSIYGFTGANPELLRHLSERKDVETVRLRLNYRCGSRIVTASTYALGEERDYAVPDGAHQGTIYFHPKSGTYAAQAEYLFATVIPQIKARVPDLTPGEIAVLYPAAFIGDDVANAAQNHGYGVVRADTNALYPRNSRLIRWLEQCGVWCCEGWRTGTPRFSKIVSEGCRLFGEVIATPEDRLAFQRALLLSLWSKRDAAINLHVWLTDIGTGILDNLCSISRTMDDESETLNALIERTSAGGMAEEMTLGQFSGCGEGNDRINLSTLHSSKGREFRVVVMFGMDNGRIPRWNPSEQDTREARRLFYVGFTRAKLELHLAYTIGRASPFVSEVEVRLNEES